MNVTSNSTWRLLLSCFMLFSFLAPAIPPATAAPGVNDFNPSAGETGASLLDEAMIDGFIDPGVDEPLAVDPLGDMTEPNLNLHRLFVSDDEDNLYIGFDAFASNWGMAYGIYLDTDQVSGSGATSDPWGRAVNAVNEHLPEYALYVWHRDNDTLEEAQLIRWNGASWETNSLSSQGGSQEYLPADDWLEYRVPKSALGNPAAIALEVFTTGGDGHAQDTVPSDPNVAYTEPDWSGDVTTLSAFVLYTPSEKFINVAGSFGSELGGNDWDPSDPTTRMNDDNNDGVWKFTTSGIPPGNWGYKVVEDQDWAKAYPADDVNLNIAAAGQEVRFYYRPSDHVVHDNVNQCIATVAGNFQSELGGDDWSPDSLVSWMTDPDGNGWYEFSALIPDGDWAYKVARDEAWTVSYPANDRPLSLAAPTQVTFRYNCATNEVQDSVNDGTGAGHDDDIWWSELGHNSRDPLYRTPGGAVPTGTPVTLRLRAASGDLTEAKLRLWDDRLNVQSIINMTPVVDDGTHEWWQATVPASPHPTIYWYRFIVIDGSDTDYYEETESRSGGWGQAYEDSLDRSYQLTVYDPSFQTPDWVKDAVIYQIFPDRFRDGDPSNNTPAGTFFYNESPTIVRSNDPDGNWNAPICDPREAGTDCSGSYSKNFYGGDLQGLLDKLDYLEDLGVTAIYLNPIFESPSNHKYDTTDFSIIDDNFGDLDLFIDLAGQARDRGIRLILDGVFNHTSSDSIYFDRYGRYSEVGACESPASPYRDWYYFTDVAPGLGACAGSDGTPNAANYESWFGFDSLPKLNSANAEVRALIWSEGTDSIGPYWMQWADGWRLDVAGDVDPGVTNNPDNDYWENFRAAIHAVNPEAYIVGEEWGNSTPWLLGHEWDASMNYQFGSAILSFWRDTTFEDNDHNPASSAGILAPLSPSLLEERLRYLEERYPPEAYYAMLNLLGSHDTNRALFMLDHNTHLNDRGLYEDPAYDWSDAANRLKGVALLQFTLPGAPTVYYGDEVGLVGPATFAGGRWEDDPYNRLPFPWLDESGAPFYTHLQSQSGQDALRDYYKLLTSARNAHPALRTGSFDTLLVDDAARVYAYGRKLADHSDAAIVILNRSGAQTVTVDVAGYLPYGAQFDELLSGVTYTVSGGGEISVNVPGQSGALLVLAAPMAAPPAAVNDLAVTGQRSGEVDLAWSAAAGADRYDVYRSLFSGGGYAFVASTGGTSFTDSGLANATAYYYVVASRNEASGLASGHSNEAQGLPQHDLASAWFNLQYPEEINHTISASNPTETIYGQIWINGATGPDGPATGILAQVGYGPLEAFPWEPTWSWTNMIFNTAAGNNDEYMGNLLPDALGDFAFTTRYSSDGGRSWHYADREGPGYTIGRGGLLRALPSDDTTPPAAPQNLALAGTTAGSISLRWDANTEPDLAGYEVYREAVASPGFSRIAVLGSGVTAYTDLNVATGSAYRYYLVAYDTSFNRSGPSNTVEATAEDRIVAATFRVRVPDYTPGTVYIAGNLPGLPQWNPGATPLTQVGDDLWEITLNIPDGTNGEYKYTRGNWETVEWWGSIVGLTNRHVSISYGADGTQLVDDTATDWGNGPDDHKAVRDWRDPIVVSFSPADGATDVPVDTTVQVAWSHAMAASTTFAVSGPAGPVPGSFAYDEASFTVTFTPGAGLDPETVYTVAASGQIDAKGDSQQVPVQFSFTTAPTEPSGPTVHVHNLDLQASQGRLRATVEVKNDRGDPVKDALVTAQFSKGAFADTLTQRTNSQGEAKYNYKAAAGEWQVCVVAIDASGYTYDPAQNVVTCKSILVPGQPSPEASGPAQARLASE